MGHRIQGVLAQRQPSAAALDAIAERYGFRMFEMPGSQVWVLDLAVAGKADRPTLRAARVLAPSYVDAIRVLDADEHDLEQLKWLVAASAIAKILTEPVLAFVSDDSVLDFAVIARPDGVAVVGDHVAPYLLRWDAGELTIQPYTRASQAGDPHPPEELELIPSVSLLPAEPLPEGVYPLHGNVSAEVYEFAPAASGVIGGDDGEGSARSRLEARRGARARVQLLGRPVGPFAGSPVTA